MTRLLYHHRTQAHDGQWVHIVEIQRALRRAGHEVVDVSLIGDAEAAGAKGDEAAQPSWKRRFWGAVAAITPGIVYELLELAYNVVAERRLARAVRAHRPDFLYERYALNTWAGVKVAKRFEIPILLEVNSPIADEKKSHGRIFLHGLSKRLESRILAGATRVLAVTDVLGQILIEEGADPAAVRVIPNGVDPRRFAPVGAAARRKTLERLGIAPDRVCVGFVGYFRPWHGIDRAISLLAAEPDLRERAHLLLVGHGPAEDGLREQVRAAGLEKHVTWTGEASREEVPDYVGAMDVVLQPQVTAYASPLKLFEYLALGKAVVAPRQPNIEEVLVDDVDALLFDPKDEDAFRAAVRRLIVDASLRERLGAAAARKIEDEGRTWDDNARRIIEIFEECRAAPDPAPCGVR